jgi:putative cell wall-binding protein
MRVRRIFKVGFLAGAATVASFAPAGAVDRVDRIAGADRYATAVAISSFFAPGVPVVFLATGENFPDALAAGPAGVVAGAPVLLTGRDALPEVVHGALNRLDPVDVVVLGGPGIISGNVLLQAQNYASGTARRVAGADRYETAALLADRFEAPVPVVYVASGLNFPDALAASPTAGALGGPLLLVHPDGIPPATAAQLDRLDPVTIVIAGGPSSVSAEVEQQLQGFGTVVRDAGFDRFATSAVISAAAYEGPVDTVFLATGLNFPDALAGGPLAGISGSPILLSRPDCIPHQVTAEIDRLQPAQVVLLGGEGALSASIPSLQPCPILVID